MGPGQRCHRCLVNGALRGPAAAPGLRAPPDDDQGRLVPRPRPHGRRPNAVLMGRHGPHVRGSAGGGGGGGSGGRRETPAVPPARPPSTRTLNSLSVTAAALNTGDLSVAANASVSIEESSRVTTPAGSIRIACASCESPPHLQRRDSNHPCTHPQNPLHPSPRLNPSPCPRASPDPRLVHLRQHAHDRRRDDHPPRHGELPALRDGRQGAGRGQQRQQQQQGPCSTLPPT